MAFRNGRGGYLAITTPTRDGVAVTGGDADDWAAATTYVAGQQVIAGSDPNQLQALCLTSHMSAVGGLTVTAGALAGTEASNWKQVPTGLVYQLSNWTLEDSEDTEAVTRVADDQDTTTSTDITATGTAEVFLDPDENVQQVLRTGNQASFTLYPIGIPTNTGAKYFTRTFDARITSVSEAFSTTPLVQTINYAVQGDITRAIATVA